ncbi:UDP-3-O-(3-hydroxymyristoyl)glucosamine N-acyltransferase [Pseudidiomarina aestuarii]|uniref:UDP-3-O-(3-hydroxymyristoyl)glucosamine N-acyltransferase n=1 Tax=Pseudidiomarina aestuarii TaxID=624146 RepID=A0A7Z6ZUP0_9GAMM|nr:UDP-3-O-(3-hydroxymyristoyl)glucosamine N-acyltransferase [Pseudidiomarina aestuarii]RUO41612.1 UDP-3-O-(3-hydroxymyristoyl)glucosamine N-acyltransferase [Pseudidiomarina aestuarii]
MGYKLNGIIELSKLASNLELEFHGLDISINGVSPADSVSLNELAFAKDSLANKVGIACIVSCAEENLEVNSCGYILSKNPRLDFIRALIYLNENIGFSTWSDMPIIHPTAHIGKNVVFEAGCVVGEHTVIEHNVVLHSGTRIGANCLIRSCSSIGGDGFGFERDSTNIPLKFPHLGGVLIGNNVEIGSCTAIARGTLGDTIIEDNVKVDNLVHIAHNCVVKKGAFIIACAELSGGVTVGENAWVAPNSCTHQKISIGAGALVGLGAVVTKDVDDFSVYAGNPAKKLRDLK